MWFPTHIAMKRLYFVFLSFSIHGHTELATQVRCSEYLTQLQPLSVECVDLDGDEITLPIIFEDVYCEQDVRRKCEKLADSIPRKKLFKIVLKFDIHNYVCHTLKLSWIDYHTSYLIMEIFRGYILWF